MGMVLRVSCGTPLVGPVMEAMLVLAAMDTQSAALTVNDGDGPADLLLLNAMDTKPAALIAGDGDGPAGVLRDSPGGACDGGHGCGVWICSGGASVLVCPAPPRCTSIAPAQPTRPHPTHPHAAGPHYRCPDWHGCVQSEWKIHQCVVMQMSM